MIPRGHLWPETNSNTNIRFVQVLAIIWYHPRPWPLFLPSAWSFFYFNLLYLLEYFTQYATSIPNLFSNFAFSLSRLLSPVIIADFNLPHSCSFSNSFSNCFLYRYSATAIRPAISPSFANIHCVLPSLAQFILKISLSLPTKPVFLFINFLFQAIKCWPFQYLLQYQVLECIIKDSVLLNS